MPPMLLQMMFVEAAMTRTEDAHAGTATVGQYLGKFCVRPSLVVTTESAAHTMPDSITTDVLGFTIRGFGVIIAAVTVAVDAGSEMSASHSIGATVAGTLPAPVVHVTFT